MRTPNRNSEEKDSAAEEDQDDVIIEEEGGEEKIEDDTKTEEGGDKPSSVLAGTKSKKMMKVAVIVVLAVGVVYKMFFSSAPPPPPADPDAVVEEKPLAPADFGKAAINQVAGSVTPKQQTVGEANNSESVRPPASSSSSMRSQHQTMKIQAPDLPPLPSFDNAIPPEPDSIMSLSQSLPVSSPAEEKGSGFRGVKLGGEDDSPAFPSPPSSGATMVTQGSNGELVKRPVNPLEVTANGIPLINADDLTFEQKRQLTMFVFEGSGPSSAQAAAIKSKPKNDFILTNQSELSIKKPSENVSTEQVSDLDITLIQGKIIDGVLETAIDSQLPGTVRGIVTSDVLGEIGTKILIPRGSRIFGTYSSQVKRGFSRLAIMWTRVVRPDGASIAINAPTTDLMGRAGLSGQVNNRSGEIMANTLLVTFATLGGAIALEKIVGSDNVSQSQVVNPAGSFSTTNIKPVTAAAQAAITTANDLARKLTEGATDLAPIVTLPQGTQLRMMVAQDLKIPPFRKRIVP